jgi:uncharacterized protein
MLKSAGWNDLLKLARRLSPARVALSGGIDSIWLFHFFKNIAKIEVIPVFFNHPGVFPEERAVAEAVIAANSGMVFEYTLAEMSAVWGDTEKERCYRCKYHLFSRMIRATDSAVTICDGTHIGDDPARRPGIRALNELGIISPLRVCGWDKEMIRTAARKAGLKVWNQPARACLVVAGKLGI